MYTSANPRLTSVTIRIRIRIQIRDPDRHQNLIILFIGALPTLPENFMQILSEVFAQSCWQTDRQTDKHTTTITYPTWRR